MISPKQCPTVAEYLHRWDWFLGLDESLQRLTLETTTELLVEPGEIIVRAGSPSTHWYGVIEGFLQMYVLNREGTETTLFCLREGEWGGDGSLLKRERLQYDLRALTASHVCLVPADTFETLRFASIGFANYLCDVMNARMGVFVGMLAAQRLGNPELQVARGLLMLVNPTENGVCHLPFSQHELALISGLSRQRVNAAINSFNRSGIVRSEQRHRALEVDVQRLKTYLHHQATGSDLGAAAGP